MDGAIRDKRTIVAQLHERLIQMIRSEALQPGDQLPTEAQLTARFGVSRPALREAFKLLEQDNLIYVRHGRGRFVSAASSLQVERPITVFESVSDMARHFGYELTNVVLSVAVVSPDDVVRQSLRLEGDAKVIRLERLRYQDGEPILYSIDYVPQSRLPGGTNLAQYDGSLLNLLELHGDRPRMSSARVTSVLLPEAVRQRDDLANFGPALLIRETCFNMQGEPVNYAIDYHRGSHFSFSLART